MADKILWESEGMAHRASLEAVGDYGKAILYVTRIRGGGMGETAILHPEDRRALAAALLKGLPEEAQDSEARVERFARAWAATSPSRTGGFDGMSSHRKYLLLSRMREVLRLTDEETHG